jgi:glycosyltransferase involved in cell wall biosynthesis
MKKKLFIFSNESIFAQDGKFFCENIDLKSTPEGLNKKFEVHLIGRKSKKVRPHEIKLKKIIIFGSFFSYVSKIINTTKEKDAKYLIISISPYTFIISIFLRLFGKKPIVYLRSDGYGEYKAILGRLGSSIYHLMFTITCSISHLISCREYILRGRKGKIVSPSQLDSTWLRQPKKIEVKSFKLLYVGRLKIEKGIFYFMNLIKNKKNIFLTIVGAEKKNPYNANQSNVKIHHTQNSKVKLMKHYDDNNIFVLPSFTEGHPMVILEALARRRPVIVFEDIKHVIGDKKGIFVCKRNYINFFGTLNNIKKNYKKIQKDMKSNKLPIYKDFIEELSQSILSYDQ